MAFSSDKRSFDSMCSNSVCTVWDGTGWKSEVQRVRFMAIKNPAVKCKFTVHPVRVFPPVHPAPSTSTVVLVPYPVPSTPCACAVHQGFRNKHVWEHSDTVLSCRLLRPSDFVDPSTRQERLYLSPMPPMWLVFFFSCPHTPCKDNCQELGDNQHFKIWTQIMNFET